MLSSICFKKQVIKIYKTTIEKYCFDIPTDEIKPLLCKSCYSFFPKKKTPKLLVSTNIKLNDPINFVKKLNELEKRLISPHLAFVQIWQLQGYGQYSIKGNIINVLANVNFTQSILPHLPHNEATIGFDK